MPTIKELEKQNQLLKEQAERERQIFELDNRRTTALKESNNLIKP